MIAWGSCCVCVYVYVEDNSTFVSIQVKKFSLFLQMLFPVYCIKIELGKETQVDECCYCYLRQSFFFPFRKWCMCSPTCDLVALCNHGDMNTNNTRCTTITIATCIKSCCHPSTLHNTSYYYYYRGPCQLSHDSCQPFLLNNRETRTHTHIGNLWATR